MDISTLEKLPADQQTAELSSLGAITRLVSSGDAYKLPQIISKLAPEQQVAVLTSPGVMEDLVRTTSQREIREIVRNLAPDTDKQATILSSLAQGPDKKSGSGQSNTHNASADIAMNAFVGKTSNNRYSYSAASMLASNDIAAFEINLIIQKLTPEQQAAVLASPGTVNSLVVNSEGYRTVEVIKKLKPDQQAAILSSEGVISALSMNGWAKSATDIIEALSPEHQTTVLSSANWAVPLMEGNLATRFTDIIQKLSPEQQTAVLSSDDGAWGTRGLLNAGEGKRVADMIERLSPDQQSAVLTPSLVEALIDNHQRALVLKLKSKNKDQSPSL